MITTRTEKTAKGADVIERALIIGEVAKRSEAGILETIRYYERQGLLAEPDRRPSGYRQYDESNS